MRFLYLVAIIFFMSLNLRPSITSVGPLLDVIQTDLGMSGVTASLLTTLPVFCMGIFSLLSIQWSNRLGIEKSLFIAMLLIFAATFLRGFLSSSLLLLATSLFSGIGIGVAGPLLSGFIKKYFPDKLSVTSVYSVSMVIGAAVATSFSIPLYTWMNDSWQQALSFWSVLAGIAALLVLPLLVTGKREPVAMTAPMMRITNPRVYGFMMFFGCMAAIFYSVTAWLAPIAKSMGMSDSQSGMILTLFTVIQIPVSFLLPILVGKTGKRKKWLLLCGVSELVGVTLLLGHASPWIATIFLGIGAGGLFPLALLIPLGEARSAEEATSWSAQMQFGGFIIGATGPLLVGLTTDVFDSSSYTPALLVIMLTIVALLAAVWNMEKKREVDRAC
ncbi:CynX/NimT family MFS transporter [Brevibacillus choshinensis]|uniref:MFS transporter n=1 Tax=Brevibacillus choshinensis TaxID=54911 RepID=A0ABX7FSC7_BRECH|nr:MFS transporter [Brevibacillus choshinensis]QRG68633.1 MFS transporter [Brevibacillus choshinensis]